MIAMKLRSIVLPRLLWSTDIVNQKPDTAKFARNTLNLCSIVLFSSQFLCGSLCLLLSSSSLVHLHVSVCLMLPNHCLWHCLFHYFFFDGTWPIEHYRKVLGLFTLRETKRERDVTILDLEWVSYVIRVRHRENSRRSELIIVIATTDWNKKNIIALYSIFFSKCEQVLTIIPWDT